MALKSAAEIERSDHTQLLAGADIEVSDHDLIADGNFESNQKDISGTGTMNIFIESNDSRVMDVEVQVLDDDGNAIATIDKSRENDLGGAQPVYTQVPVFGDRAKVIIKDASGAGQNKIQGGINFSAGSPTLSTAKRIQQFRHNVQKDIQNPAADISGGVTFDLSEFMDGYDRLTLFLNAGAAVDVTVELSPDDGTDWFTIPESPISIPTGGGDDITEITYDGARIRLTGSNTTPVLARYRSTA